MSRLDLIKEQRVQRKKRVRSTIVGSSERPRLSVSVSNRHITAQLIDDDKSKTIVYASTVGKKMAEDSMTKKAAIIGAELAKKAKAKKINSVVFDRGSKIYHGRVKALADAAREGGLEF